MTKTEIDSARIQQRFAEIEERLKFLKESSQVDKVTFLADHRISASSERDLEIAIQACLDIADHLIAKLGLELPKKDRKETFNILQKHAIIPKHLVPKLTAMAGQRNILVHEYLEVEREQIYKTIKENLGDIIEFVKAIQQFLDKISSSKYQNGFAPIFIVLVIVIIGGLIGGAYLLGKQANKSIGNSPKPTTIQLQPSPSPIPPTSTPQIPTVTPTPNPTVNWKTYTNSTLGFSFRYPSNYFKFQQAYPDSGIYLAPSQGDGGNGPKFLKSDDVWLDVSALDGSNLKSLDDYLSLPGQQIYPANATKTPTTIDGVRGYIIDYNFPVSAGNITQYSKVGIVFRNEKIYIISLSAWGQNTLQKNQQMFDQILSAFSFTQ